MVPGLTSALARPMLTWHVAVMNYTEMESKVSLRPRRFVNTVANSVY